MEVMAGYAGESLEAWASELRGTARAAEPASGVDFDPLRPVSAQKTADEQACEEAIALVSRGVRVAPFAESTPLAPLYEVKKQELPPHLLVQHRDQRYDFVHVELTFSLLLEDDEIADSAEFVVSIDDGVTGPRATRAIQVFPEGIHKSWFKAGGQVSVGLDTSLQFSVSAKNEVAGGQAEGTAETKLSALLGPFELELGTAELDVIGEGDREIGWRYLTKDSLSGARDFKSYLVLKVARETKEVALQTNIGVKTYRRSWRSLWLREALPVLRANAALGVELPPR